MAWLRWEGVAKGWGRGLRTRVWLLDRDGRMDRGRGFLVWAWLRTGAWPIEGALLKSSGRGLTVGVS